MEPLPLVCLCLLTWSGAASADRSGSKVVRVKEGTDAVLPCLIDVDLESKLFNWKKDGHQEVFLYDAGIHYNGNSAGQDEQFKGRVSHFQDDLQRGNASIIIRNTKVADSGNYTCAFPRLQPPRVVHIELVVGASPKPSITSHDATKDWSLLLCVVQGASPEPKVEWKDSSGNIVPAEEPQVTQRGGSYDVSLKATVTKTGRYRCVVTQEEIHHQTSAETYVYISGSGFSGLVTAVVVLSLLLVAVGVGLSVFCIRHRIKQHFNKDQVGRLNFDFRRDDDPHV